MTTQPSDTKHEGNSISEKSLKSFLDWFRFVYGRGWLDIKNDRQDDESINSKRGYEAGYLAGMLEGWKWP